MSPVQTVLVFVGIPAGVLALIFAAVFGPAEMRQPNRYRPGRPWNYRPVWYLPHPDHPGVSTGSAHHALPGASGHAALEAAALDAPHESAVGGAVGEW